MDYHIEGLQLNDLGRVRVVMIETSLAANIGAAARAMKTMGLQQLVVVNPQQPLDSEPALARASGAEDVLTAAVQVPDLDAALTGCSLVVGTSARNRSVPWPMLTPREVPDQLAQLPAGAELAILFGRERSGLTNEELARCHYHVHIPANPDYSSLNIAAAVQIMAYELRLAALAGVSSGVDGAPKELAKAEDLAGYFAHMEAMLVDIGFADPNNLRQLMIKLRRFYLRAQPEPTELNILRGIVSQTQKMTRR